MSEYKVGQRVRLHDGVINTTGGASGGICITLSSGVVTWISKHAIAEVLPDPIKAGDVVYYLGSKSIVISIDCGNSWVKRMDGSGYSTAAIAELVKRPASE